MIGETSGAKRSHSLDVLRGLAISLVLVRHFPTGVAESTRGIESVVQWARLIGVIGVDLFFVLSGFLISGLIFKEYDQRGSFDGRRFWLRRGMKIWPAYFVAYGSMTLLQVIWKLWGGDAPAAARLLEQASCNVVFLQNYLPCGAWSHSWSLAVEEHFYTAFALIAVFACKRGKAMGQHGRQVFAFLVPMFLVVAVMVAVMRGMVVFDDYANGKYIAYYRSHLRIDSIFFGVLLGYLTHYGVMPDWARQLRWPSVVIALTCAFLTASVWPYGQTPWAEFIGFTLVYLSFGCVVVGAANKPDFGVDMHGVAGTALRMLARLGVYSYTIYLAHSIVFGIPGFESLRQHALRIVLPIFGESASSWLDRITFLAMSILGGVILSHMVERPFLRLRGRILPSVRQQAELNA